MAREERENHNTEMEIDLTLKLDAQDQELAKEYSSKSDHVEGDDTQDDEVGDTKVKSPEHEVQESQDDAQTTTNPTEKPERQDLNHDQQEKVQPFKP